MTTQNYNGGGLSACLSVTTTTCNNTKTESAILAVARKNYKNLYEGFHDGKKMNPIEERKEALNLFKLVTDPRQREWFKPRYFLYPKTKTSIPQEHIDRLMQWPKNTS